MTLGDTHKTGVYHIQHHIPIHLHVISTILELDLVPHCLLWQSNLENLIKDLFVSILENERHANESKQIVLECLYVMCIDSMGGRMTKRPCQKVLSFFQCQLIGCNSGRFWKRQHLVTVEWNDLPKWSNNSTYCNSNVLLLIWSWMLMGNSFISNLMIYIKRPCTANTILIWLKVVVDQHEIRR